VLAARACASRWAPNVEPDQRRLADVEARRALVIS
jgi:hypothetical protein